MQAGAASECASAGAAGAKSAKSRPPRTSTVACMPLDSHAQLSPQSVLMTLLVGATPSSIGVFMASRLDSGPLRIAQVEPRPVASADWQVRTSNPA